jgi:FkbM family methyltransferase
VLRWHISLIRNGVVDWLFRKQFSNPALRREIQLTHVGSHYGGYWIPSTLLLPSSKDGLLLSAGLGFDVSFDLALLKIGFRVVALDPLPQAAQFAESSFAGQDAVVLVAGLWTRDGNHTFFAPRIPEHDSWSLTDLQETGYSNSQEFTTVSLESLAQDHPQLRGPGPCVLKMNIEGAENNVLAQLCESTICFDVLVVHLEAISQTRLRSPVRFLKEVLKAHQTLGRMQARGYQIVRVRNLQMVIVNTSRDLFAL